MGRDKKKQISKCKKTPERIRQGETLCRKLDRKRERVSQRHKKKLSGRKRQPKTDTATRKEKEQ